MKGFGHIYPVLIFAMLPSVGIAKSLVTLPSPTVLYDYAASKVVGSVDSLGRLARLESRRGGKNYLQYGRPPQMVIDYPIVVIPQPPEDVKNQAAPPSFIDFLARVKETSRVVAEDIANSEKVVGGSSNASVVEKVEGDRAIITDPSASILGNESLLRAQIAAVTVPRQQSSNRVKVEGGTLFSRPSVRNTDQSKMLLYFPVNSTEQITNGDYSVLTPADRFNYFAPPNQSYPRSSVEYKSNSE